jgi:pimeloyl-ACP methyl ester carboxylesterase
MGKTTSHPLLLLHGSDNLSSGRDMYCLAEPLIDLGYRVIIPDLPGYGMSPGLRERCHADEYPKEGGSIQV